MKPDILVYISRCQKLLNSHQNTPLIAYRSGHALETPNLILMQSVALFPAVSVTHRCVFKIPILSLHSVLLLKTKSNTGFALLYPVR